MKPFIDFSGFIGKDMELKGKRGKVLAVVVRVTDITSDLKITFVLQASEERKLGYKVAVATVDLEAIANGEVSIIE